MKRSFVARLFGRSLRPLPALALPAMAALAFGCSESTSSGMDLGVESIVFIQRAHTTVDENGAVSVNVSNGNGQTLDYTRYVPGGRLVVLSPPRPDGKLVNLTARFPNADFNGAALSFDASEVVFSMRPGDGDDHYHLYAVSLKPDANGEYALTQLTAGNHNDITPAFLAGGRIGFSTDQPYTAMGRRADEYNHARSVTQIATIARDGGDGSRRHTAHNVSHSVSPFARFDGTLGFSRWEHLGPVNDVKLFAMNVDGTNIRAIAGQHGKPANSLFSVREIEPNVMIGIATSRSRTIHAGALVRIDARNRGGAAELLDEEAAEITVLTPDVPTGNGPSPVGRYREPNVLPDGRIIVSWAEGPVNDLAEQSATPPDFGIYLFDPATQKNQLVFNDRNFWDVGVLPVVARKEPPALGDLTGADDLVTPAVMGSIDVRLTSLRESVSGAQFNGTPLSEALKQATKVRIIEGFSSEGAPGVTQFGITMHEGASILGEATVNADGSWLSEVPGYMPVHLQPIDKFGLAIRNQMLWIQSKGGSEARCVGCHESRTGVGVSLSPNPTVAEIKGPERFALSLADRVQNELTWVEKVQTVMDAKCVQCHDGGANDPFAGKTYTVTGSTMGGGGETASYTVPYLKLTGDPITVNYDRMDMTLATSYVTLFYPAGMAMGPRGGSVTGDVPPMWAIPGDARNSKLIEKLNVRAPDGSLAWADKPLHPEDKGVTLTDAERLVFIRNFDAGGQYYGRLNTAFKPYSGALSGDGAGREYP